MRRRTSASDYQQVFSGVMRARAHFGRRGDQRVIRMPLHVQACPVSTENTAPHGIDRSDIPTLPFKQLCAPLRFFR